MDPVLGPRHSGGLFEVIPRRSVVARSLRADLVLVSHAHFDHFDVDSLFELARLDPDIVVVTPDALVAEVCGVLGFRTVRTVAPGTRVELAGGLSLATTPSRAPDVEWGVVAQDASGVVWNLVDTMLSGPDEVRRVRDAACGGRRVDVALAALQPMREIALSTADFVGFVASDYRHMLASAAAIEAAHVVPSAAGDAHAPPFEGMNAWAYPVSAERAAADLAVFAPRSRVLVPGLGDAITIGGGSVEVGRGDVAIELGAAGDPRVFRPLEPMALVDPDLNGAPSGALLDRICRWVEEDLAPAIARVLSRDGASSGLRLVLEVVLPGDRVAFTLGASGRVRRAFDPEYDMLNVVAGSMLVEVIEGRRAWYEPLLAGVLRSSVRGCLVRPGRVEAISLCPMFVYEALEYRLSTERAARFRAGALVRARGDERA